RMIGVFALGRRRLAAFSPRQIELVNAFADQAVIAIENVRLIAETREALAQQTATAEVLQVINASPGDLPPGFQAILEKAHQLCAVDQGSLQLADGDSFRAVATHNLPPALEERLRQGYRIDPALPSWELVHEGGSFVQADMAALDHPISRAAVEGGLRTVL